MSILSIAVGCPRLSFAVKEYPQPSPPIGTHQLRSGPSPSDQLPFWMDMDEMAMRSTRPRG